ncbi:MAG: hypothetical protein RTU30_10480 [Candidatus Thorarchaeota archaeon]
MMNTSEELLDERQKKFLIKYWKMTIVMAVVCAAAVVVALGVFLLVMDNLQATTLVPSLLGQWTIGYIVTFCFNVILWELVFVVSWVIPIVGAFFLWYRKLPDEDRRAWPQRGTREDGGFIGFIVGLTWLIMVYIDGRWDIAFQAWTLDDWVYSWIGAALLDLLFFGVPVLVLAVLWFINREMKKLPETVEEVVDEPSEEATD